MKLCLPLMLLCLTAAPILQAALDFTQIRPNQVVAESVRGGQRYVKVAGSWMWIWVPPDWGVSKPRRMETPKPIATPKPSPLQPPVPKPKAQPSVTRPLAPRTEAILEEETSQALPMMGPSAGPLEDRTIAPSEVPVDIPRAIRAKDLEAGVEMFDEPLLPALDSRDAAQSKLSGLAESLRTQEQRTALRAQRASGSRRTELLRLSQADSRLARHLEDLATKEAIVSTFGEDKPWAKDLVHDYEAVLGELLETTQLATSVQRSSSQNLEATVEDHLQAGRFLRARAKGLAKAM